MKKQGIFTGITLIGLGAYFLINQLQLPLLSAFQGWPTLFVIFGIALLGQAYSAREYQHIFPGTILFGFGLHFLLIQLSKRWPNNVGMFFFIIAVAFLLSSRKMKSGFIQSLFFFALACIILFSERWSRLFHVVENGITFLWNFWPIGLIISGIYILLIKRK
ncbi:LiaI-LiaF-like domain-containing protein [Thermaerobacillus caldiproteolyticus]|uniref:Membrane-bound ClpP family serine protease n=1 Tax=Thermaerobacillus caldiproteolyticus TaxID=247480 RepID=A0A7V9Z426_9BACL|nr:DUF5668 domain-containing protein [Anoxybacillus caldiproteolyticus]MBA2873687.1 membrane-bound ClpP family serine protease [Anoxybacillus caldiproteolyticus]QPA30259.1 hypothetical protein ISX45_11485 [Anoxybacillus caldiproteolyticus]